MLSLNEQFFEIQNHLLKDEKPSIFLNDVSDTSIFKEFPLILLENLKHTEQSPKHHPEGNVWNHTMLVVDEAAHQKNKSSDELVFMWAALLHDIGKYDTTKVRNGKITSYDHDKLGEKLAERFLSEFKMDSDFIKKVTTLVRWHMQILFVANELPFADIEAMKKQTDINEVALLGLCDRMGRKGANAKTEQANIKEFIEKCNKG